MLRVGAVALVLCVHTAQVFSPWQTWHVQNETRSRVLGEGMLLVGPWLMPLFMLLAGRSAWYSLARRNDRAYLVERIQRVLLPLVAGTLVLVPPQIYVHRTLDGSFSGSFVSFYPEFFRGIFPRGNFTWAHLWFLAYLFVYAVVTLPVFRWLARVVPTRPEPSGRTILLAGGLLIVAQIALRDRFPQNNALAGDWANHAQLLPAFVLGFLLTGNQRFEHALVRYRWHALVMGTLASAVLAVLAWQGRLDERLESLDYRARIAVWAIYTIGAWTWLCAISAYARLHIRAESSLVRYARNAAFPVYLVHQTVIVLIGWWVVRLVLPVSAKFLLLTFLSFVASILAYETLRHTVVGRLLLGLRSRSVRPASH
ncbi:MAG: acyltransferase [Gemmatimonadota bacterium]